MLKQSAKADGDVVIDVNGDGSAVLALPEEGTVAESEA